MLGMGLRKYNPIKRGGWKAPTIGQLDFRWPDFFFSNVKSIQLSILANFQKFLTGNFPARYGLSKKGYTLADWRDLAKLTKGDVPKNITAALLTQRGSDMDNIMMCQGQWDSPGLRKIADIYWDNFDFEETDQEMDRRMEVVLHLLRAEILEKADSFGITIDQEPLRSTTTGKLRGYTSGPYRVFPIRFYVEDYLEVTR